MSDKIYVGTHKEWGITYTSTNKQKVIDELNGKEEDVDIQEMNMDDYILLEIPEEFHSPLKYLAYLQGHAYGEPEVLSILGDLVDHLKEPIQRFEKRVEKDYEEYRNL